MKNIIFNGSQQKELHNALMSAFPNRIALEKMLLFELDKQLEEIVGGTNLSDSVFTLIRTAISQGWLEDLVFAAHDSNPGNQLLFSFLRQHYLKSDRGIDYTQLRDFLKAGKWKEADEETLAVMLEASGKKREDGLDISSFENFPCTDLRTIDQLWVKYSNGRFGFSVQKQIYLDVRGIPDGEIHNKVWLEFSARVGWRVPYKEMTYDITDPRGHLPLHYVYMDLGCARPLIDTFQVSIDHGNKNFFSSLASRLVNCNM